MDDNKLNIAYTWVNGCDHREWCNIKQYNLDKCNCGKDDVLKTLTKLKTKKT